MSKLYYTNPYQETFTAEIVSILEKEGQFHIVLDQTAFYPEGGGQPCDLGFIEDSQVLDVYEENEIIYHVTSKKPIKIHKAKCTIDWKRRFDHMQHHLAQHLFSACLLECFKANTLSFHLGKEFCTLDIDTLLSSEDLLEMEHLVNERIGENIPVDALTPTKQELKKLSFNKPLPKVNGPIRLIQIGDLDLGACCGLHPRSTIELQMFKILKREKHKGGLRITFIAGQRAIQNALANDQDTLAKIQDLTKECQSLQSETRKLKTLISEYEAKETLLHAPTIGSYKVVRQIYNQMDTKELQNFGSKLTSYPGVIALLGLNCDKTSYLVFMCSKDIKQISMNTLLKDSITLIDGRGGGSDHSAQGGGKSANNLDSALDYALMKLKSFID